MRIEIQILLFSFLIVACNSTDSSSEQKPTQNLNMTGTHFKRTTLLVSDLEKSLTIYKDILGFTIHKISESDEDSYSYPVFKIPKEAKIRFCTLDSPDQIRTLALTEVKGISLPRPQTPYMTAAVIRVENLPEVMKRIESLGLEFTDIKIDESSDGLLFMEQSFVDFDGHLVVLYEMTQ